MDIRKFMRTINLRLVFVISIIILLTTGCRDTLYSSASATPIAPTSTDDPTSTLTPSLIPPTATSTYTPIPTWIYQPAGNLICPILLYHHVFDKTPPALYYISIEDFTAEMNLLHSWGYTTIPISLLVQAITEGASLPQRPVVITFDDGDEDVYTNAFPIMQQMDFRGVLYLVNNYIGAKDYLTIPEIIQLAAAGWEVGDHSLTHPHLLSNPDQLHDEAVLSRSDLQATLGLPIETFAYPFGEADENIMAKISRYGYKAAVGLGPSTEQGPSNLFYLNRIVLDYTIDINKFTSLMPWSGPIK
jgi:peptidoglycan/xylan/chitin deacetylase (PgdA/CDA1 family)